ncbi:diguanylate cyclase domain-containing protein [Oceanimonas baumannii]|uniref:diguanylate cyclase domain-containing protein n=1 Tax=Oceanimonas baumannii TaxID=129578 RepID=UPI003A93E3A5
MLKQLWNRMLKSLMFSEHSEPSEATPAPDKLTLMLNAIPDLMFEIDADGRHYDFRALRPELLVVPPEKIIGRTISEMMPREAAEALLLALKEASVKGYAKGTQVELPTSDGIHWFEVSIAKQEQVEGEEPRFIALSRDITDRKHKQLEIERLAYTDALTRLPNRILFEKRLRLTLASCEQTGLHAALLFLDLDDFKQLNDGKGHDIGDAMLAAFAERLRASVRSQDLVARWGGDEFAVIIEALDSDRETATAQADRICRQLVSKLEAPYCLKDDKHNCHVSIGASVFNHEKGDIETLLKQADRAMYGAKEKEGSHYHFSLDST